MSLGADERETILQLRKWEVIRRRTSERGEGTHHRCRWHRPVASLARRRWWYPWL